MDTQRQSQSTPGELFRREALEYSLKRLEGEVVIEVPTRWTLTTIVLCAAALGAIVLLLFGSHARTETVEGVITPDGGEAAILPLRPGIVRDVYVTDAQVVSRGDALVSIWLSNSLSTSGSAISRTLEAIDKRSEVVRAQLQATRDLATAEAKRLADEIDGITSELQALSERSTAQDRLVIAAREEIQRLLPLAAAGYVTQRDVSIQKDRLLSREVELAELRHLHVQGQSKLKQLRSTLLERESLHKARVLVSVTPRPS